MSAGLAALVGDPLCAVAGWLKLAVLALPVLYGDRQIRALRDDDRRASVYLAERLGRLQFNRP